MGQVELNVVVRRLAPADLGQVGDIFGWYARQLGGDIRGSSADAGLLAAHAEELAELGLPFLVAEAERRDRRLCLRRAVAPQARLPLHRRKTRCSSHRTGPASASADGC